MNPPYHTPTPQRIATTTSQYPYDSRSHTYHSPSGMNYPAPTGSSNHLSGPYKGTHRQPTNSSMGMTESQHLNSGMTSSHSGFRTTYGPGDWLPQPRAASEVYNNQSQYQYSTPYHGHSAPVTPYGLQQTQPHSPSPSSMIQPWALESGGVSSGSYLSPGYNSAPLYVQNHGPITPSRHLSPSPGHPRPHTAGMTDQPHSRPRSAGMTDQPHNPPRAEGRDRNRQRAGPPPKAVLGGVGGKTWDELRATDRAVSTPLPPRSVPSSENTPRHPTDIVPLPEEDTGPKFKGNPIVFRPPSSTYSPPDSPDRHQPLPTEATVKEEAEKKSPPPKQPRRPRKEAFPWPARKPRGPPETIPLPLSPSDTTMKGRRRNMRTGVSRDIVRDGGGTIAADGDKIPISIPDPDAWEQLKAEAQQRRQSAKVRRKKSGSRGSQATEGKSQKNDLSPEQGGGMKAPSAPARSQSDQSVQNHSRRPSSTGTSAILSPPTSRRGTGNRIGDNDFIRRQLGGMIKERTKSVEKIPAPQERRPPAQARGSLSIDEDKVQLRILGHAKVAPGPPSSEIVQRPHDSMVSILAEDQAEKVLDWTEMPGDTDTNESSKRRLEHNGTNLGQPELGGEEPISATVKKDEEVESDLTPLQQARQRVEESRKAKRVAEGPVPDPEKIDHQDVGVSAGHEAGKAIGDMPPESTRKRKIKLANFDGYLGRQLGVSGLLGPKTREKKTEMLESNNTGQSEKPAITKNKSESAPTSHVSQDKVDSQDPDVVESSKKRVRSTSTQDPRPSTPQAPPIGFGPAITGGPLGGSSLRPTAYTFQPRPSSVVTGTAFKLIPEGSTSFNFSGESGTNTLRPAAAVFMPRQSISSAIESAVLKSHPPVSTPAQGTVQPGGDTSGPLPPPHQEPASASEGQTESRSDGDGKAVSESPSRNSPAAEIHGIYDSSPIGSVSDDDLFYRPPRSDVSESAPEELESFDPVSYSYDPTDGDTFGPSDPSGILTSTPRGEHSDLHGSSGSSASTASWHAPEVESPANELALPGPSLIVGGNVNAVDAKQKFKTWVFPKSPHGYKPSISRRHTFDIQYDPTGSDDGPNGGMGDGGSPTRVRPGVASTLASRVGDLRAFLARDTAIQERRDHLRVSSGPDHLIADRSSVEFPIRSPTKILAVVNDDLSGEEGLAPSDSGTPPTSGPEIVELRHLMERLQSTMEHLFSGSGGEPLEAKGELAEKMTMIMNKLDSLVIPPPDLSTLASAVEQQSTLISSMASTLQNQKAHSGDHLVPLLEGQQAIMDRFENLSATNETLANELENISSAMSKQDQNQYHKTPEVEEQNRQAQQEARESKSVIGDLRNRLSQLQLEKDQERSRAEKAVQQLSETVLSLEADFEATITRNQKVLSDYQELRVDRQRLRDDYDRSSSELEETKQELASIKSKQENETVATMSDTQAEEMAKLRNVTEALQEMMSTRLRSMEENLLASASTDPDEVMELRKRNTSLEQEVIILRNKLEDSQAQNHAAQIASNEQRSELDQIRIQLDHERDLRQQWQARSETVEGYLNQDREYRTNAEVVARERTYVAELQEARIAGLLEDVHHWRSFAMAYDKRAYREFLKSNPFKGFPPTTTDQVKNTAVTDLDSPPTEDDDSETVKAIRPTPLHSQPQGQSRATPTNKTTDANAKRGNREKAEKSEIIGPL